jgi:hypothetical protein
LRFVCSVSVDVDVAGSGLNDALERPGRPDTLRFTCPLNPFAGVMVTA